MGPALSLTSPEPVACPGTAYGEIPHGVLFLSDPDATPPEWRVLLVNTGDPDVPNQQQWWIWDPATPSIVTEGDPPVQASLFCSGHSLMWDGRILFAGAQDWTFGCNPYGAFTAYVYDPFATPPLGALGPGEFVSIGPMQKRRFYPSTSQTPEGTYGVWAGDNPPGAGHTFEVYDPVLPGWVAGGPFAYSTVPQCPSTYPQIHLLPPSGAGSRGTVFVSSPYAYDVPPPPGGGSPCAPSIPTQVLNLPLTGFGNPPAWIVGPTPVSATGSSATEKTRLDCGSVLIVDCTPAVPVVRVVMGSGREAPAGVFPSATIESIADPQAGGQWANFPSLGVPRFDANFVLLPGRRLLVGGGTGVQVAGYFAVLTPELLDLTNPAATWQPLADHQARREYHSFVLLLPDGRVLFVGGRRGSVGGTYYHAEILSPPNLFVDTRPVFRTAPNKGHFNTTITVQLTNVPPSGIASFELIRAGSMTHSTGFDQRLVRLSFVPGPGPGQYTLTIPAGDTLVPRGWYMLFAVTGLGAPCATAHWIQIVP